MGFYAECYSGGHLKTGADLVGELHCEPMEEVS